MHARRHVGPLVGPDALAALVHEVAGEAQPPRAEDQEQPGDDGRRGEHALADGGEVHVGGKEQPHAPGDEQDSQAGPRLPARPLDLAPDDHQPDRSEHRRPHDAVAHPEPGVAQEEQTAQEDEPERAQPAHVPDAPSTVGGEEAGELDRVLALLGYRQPAEPVEHDPDPAAEGEDDERDPDDDGVDAQPVGEARGDARHHPATPAPVHRARSGHDSMIAPTRRRDYPERPRAAGRPPRG